MKESVDVTVQLKSDRLREEAQNENESFLNNLDATMQKIIKEQFNTRVKKEVSKILLRIENLVNEQLEYEVLIRSSHESKSSHAVTTNLSKLELKKILIYKMESNKSIDRSDEQKNLYKALIMIKNPPLEQTGGSKRRRAGKELESSSAPKETTSKSTGKSTEGSKSHHMSAGQSALAEEPIHTEDDFEEPTHQEFETGVNDDQPEDEIHPHPDWFQKPTRLPSPDCGWNKTLPADHRPIQPWLSNLDRQEDPRESFDELMDTLLDFSVFVMNRLKVDTLTPELLVSPTFELMKGTCKSLIIEWHGYKHLDWITVRRDDDKLYSFKEGDLKRLRLQDIEDMLILLVQGKLSNLKIEERVESYQKKLNITKPDTYRSDLRRREQYTAYSSPRGFIYQNKDKKNRLMRLDELHKFSDGTLDDVRTALDDRLKGIRMEYLPKTIWRQSDRERATAMIQAIDKRLKSRRIMRSLERFVDKMDSMHSTLSMYYDYGAHVKGELLVTMKNFQNSILQAGNPVKEILHKLNLPDHRILKDGGEALGWHLEEIHVTWAYLEKKGTRLRLYTKSFEEIMHTERGDGVTNYKRRRHTL
ncbi:hypothetical protein Tco_0764238 [Tanacetum coccineum]